MLGDLSALPAVAAVRDADRGDDQGQTDDVERTLRQQDEVEEGLRVLKADAAEAGQLVGVDLVRDDGGEGERGGDSASSSAVSESESGGRNSSRSCRRRSLSLSVLGEREKVSLPLPTGRPEISRSHVFMLIPNPDKEKPFLAFYWG